MRKMIALIFAALVGLIVAAGAGASETDPAPLQCDPSPVIVESDTSAGTPLSDVPCDRSSRTCFTDCTHDACRRVPEGSKVRCLDEHSAACTECCSAPPSGSPETASEDPPGYCVCCPGCKAERGAKTCEAACDNCSEYCAETRKAKYFCNGVVGCSSDDSPPNPARTCSYSERAFQAKDASDAERQARNDWIPDCRGKVGGKWTCKMQSGPSCALGY